jgi:hypothetical protein
MNKKIFTAALLAGTFLSATVMAQSYTAGDVVIVQSSYPPATKLFLADGGGVAALTKNNGSDFLSPSTARTNLGLAIGTNVEAWSATLDSIAGGTWAGSTAVTTLGTIATGTWHGTTIATPYLPLGISVNDPGTGAIEQLLETTTLAGASKTYACADLWHKWRRSNSGSSMTDTLPAAVSSCMANGAEILIANADASAVITLTAGAGSTVKGGATLTLPIGRDVWFSYDTATTDWKPIADTYSLIITNGAVTAGHFATYKDTTGTVLQDGGVAGAIASLGIGTGLGSSGGNLNLQPSALATIGGVEAINSVSHNWINSISIAGVPSLTQPAFTDISGTLPLSQMANETANTVLGNNTGSSAAPVALTQTQLTAMINAATTSLSGALPAWPNNTTTFFRGDGTYATLNFAALGGSLSSSQCPAGTSSNLGCVEPDGTTLSNSSGAISLNLGNANTWTAGQTFNTPTIFGNSQIYNGTTALTENQVVVAPSGGTGSTANAYGFSSSNNLQPGTYSGSSCNTTSGVGCSFAFGEYLNETLSGSGTTTLSFVGHNTNLTVTNSFTGVATNALDYEAGDLTLGTGAGGGTPPSNFYEFFGVASTVYNGLASGTYNVRGLSLGTSSAAAGTGETLNIEGVHIDMPTGSSSGTTQYGLSIIGNGGAASTVMAIHDTSLAEVLLDGGVQLSTASGGPPSPGYINGLGYKINGSAIAFSNLAGSSTFSQLPTIASGDLYGNSTGGTAVPADTTLTALIDEAFGNTQGDIIYRGPSAWVLLAPATAAQFLETQGSSANVKWASPPININGIASAAQGSGTTDYYPCGAGRAAQAGTSGGTPVAYSGTLKGFYVALNGSAGAGQSHTLTVYVNGSATSIVATCTNVSSCSDTTDTASITAGQGCMVQDVTSVSAASLIPGWGIGETTP